MDVKEYALVLSGGGAKGSYEMGVWKALKESDIKINAVFGTSVGAINSAIVANNDFNSAYRLWKEISLDKIVEIPSELIKGDKFFLDFNNLSALKKLQKNFFSHKGLNTAPLKNLIKRAVTEDKIRKSGIDFGVVTYDISSYKPLTVFIEDMPNGLLIDYVVASSSIPLIFKPTGIKDKVFIDGGVHNNIPYDVAKERGYKNIIVVDISGFGIEKEIDITGTNTIYIKNSIDMGSILDFSQKFIHDYMELGYLDALKILGKINGVKYFYKDGKKDIKKIEKIFHKTDFIIDLKKLLNFNENDFSDIKRALKEILPKEFKNNINYISSLAECAALSLGLERIYLFGSFKEFLKEIYGKYNKTEKVLNEKNYSLSEMFSRAFKKGINTDSLFKKSIYEYENILSKVFGFENKNSDFFNGIFPYIKAAKVFFLILEYYFKDKRIF